MNKRMSIPSVPDEYSNQGICAACPSKQGCESKKIFPREIDKVRSKAIFFSGGTPEELAKALNLDIEAAQQAWNVLKTADHQACIVKELVCQK